MKASCDIPIVGLSLILASGCSVTPSNGAYSTHSVCELASEPAKYKSQVLVARGVIRDNGFSGLELEGSCPENIKINLGRGGDIPKETLLADGEMSVRKNIISTKGSVSENEQGEKYIYQVLADVEIKFDVDSSRKNFSGQIIRFRNSRTVRVKI